MAEDDDQSLLVKAELMLINSSYCAESSMRLYIRVTDSALKKSRALNLVTPLITIGYDWDLVTPLSTQSAPENLYILTWTSHCRKPGLNGIICQQT